MLKIATGVCSRARLEHTIGPMSSFSTLIIEQEADSENMVNTTPGQNAKSERRETS